MKYFNSCYYFFYCLVEKKNKILCFFPVSLSVVCPLSSFSFSFLLFLFLIWSTSFLHFFISLFTHRCPSFSLIEFHHFYFLPYDRVSSFCTKSSHFKLFHLISFHFIPFHIFSDWLQCESHLPRTSSRRPINRRNKIFFKCSKRNFFRI